MCPYLLTKLGRRGGARPYRYPIRGPEPQVAPLPLRWLHFEIKGENDLSGHGAGDPGEGLLRLLMGREAGV
jgi:hypothetical protein